MTTFGLVHGAYHGAWCWEGVAAELAARGHRSVAVDLPCDDPDAGAAEYAAVVVAALADSDPDSDTDTDVVLVGHSLGGLTIPVVATSRPVRHLIYLCAFVPRPGRAYDDVMKAEPDMMLEAPRGAAYRGPNGATYWHPEAAAAYFFAGCDPAVAARAAARLRGQCWRITHETSPLDSWPEVPTTSLVGARDTVVNPAWSTRVARDVLGVEPVLLDTGHAPFLSAPSMLADALLSCTEQRD